MCPKFSAQNKVSRPLFFFFCLIFFRAVFGRAGAEQNVGVLKWASLDFETGGTSGAEKGFSFIYFVMLGEGGVSCIRKNRIKEINPRLILFSLFTRLKAKNTIKLVVHTQAM